MVALDGVPLPVLPGLVHYLLNKPAGVVTTAHDPHGRPTVVDLCPTSPGSSRWGGSTPTARGCSSSPTTASWPSASPTRPSGSRRSTSPRSRARPSAGALRRLRQGVELDDGMTAPATVGVVAPGVLRIVIHEGRNRQIRRMCEAVGHPVRRLVRTRIGPLSDRASKPGAVAAALERGRGAAPSAALRPPGRDRPGQRRDAGRAAADADAR